MHPPSQPSNESLRRGAVVLCGGRSRRMGRAKALLPFGPETMLQRTLRLTSAAVDLICVAAAKGQELPPMPAEVLQATDQRTDGGPLEGLAAGLAALGDRVDAAFVTGCDFPLLEPRLVTHLFELLGEHQAVVPSDGHRDYPLTAVYRASILPTIERMLAEDQRAMHSLLERISTRRVDVEALRPFDLELRSLHNINTPSEYEQALQFAGLDR